MRLALRRYVECVMAQRVGPVTIDENFEDDDLTVIQVPSVAVGFVTGSQGNFLRQVEEEWSTLMFFADFRGRGERHEVTIAPPRPASLSCHRCRRCCCSYRCCSCTHLLLKRGRVRRPLHPPNTVHPAMDAASPGDHDRRRSCCPDRGAAPAHARARARARAAVACTRRLCASTTES